MATPHAEPLVLTTLQTRLVNQLCAFEADPNARLLIVQMPRFYGATTALVEHVVFRSTSDALWVTDNRLRMEQLLRFRAGTGTRRIDVVKPADLSHDSLRTALGGRPGGCKWSPADIIFHGKEFSPLVVVDGTDTRDLSWLPTHPSFSGLPEHASCFDGIKTVVVMRADSTTEPPAATERTWCFVTTGTQLH
jgi:hypothetical protein